MAINIRIDGVGAHTTDCAHSFSPRMPSNGRQETFMSDTYIIETRDGAAGIVVRDGRGFRFFAATHDFNGLDGQLFATPRAAEAAANDQLCSLSARSRSRRSPARAKKPRQCDTP
jgi:hypothetical protein